MSDKENKENKDTKIQVDFTTSPGFSSFLAKLRVSVVVSTYQTGNIFFFGPDRDDYLAVSPIKMPRPMGMCVFDQSVLVGGRSQIWRYNNILPPGVVHEGADKIYVPQMGWTIGDLDAHDIVRESSGRVVFVNTLYSCLATVSENHSFSQVWRPPCIKELAPEDRCHLNGLTTKDGKIAYASAFSMTNTKQGWRAVKELSGVIWDVRSNQVVAEKLTMPHSPRWYGDKLWCLESGSGAFGHIDPATKRFVPKLNLPGYLRGLSFVNEYAFIGSSIPREKSGIKHAALETTLAEKGQSQKCGIFVVNWQTNKLVHFVRISGHVQEVYDVALLPGTARPKAYGLEDEAIETLLNIGPEQRV